jgi:tetratricopeptide (TPR) repeat protein
MEFGVWLFEGLRSLLVTRNEQTVGEALSAAEGAAQFPAQTLSYTTGSPLDIALLYAASLEAGGIRAGLIFLPGGDMLAAFDLGIGTDDAVTAALFNGPDKLLLLDGEVWLPVAVYRMGDGFTAAWQEGIRRIDALLAGEEAADMVIFEDAWAHYPPAPFPATGITIAQPEPKALAQAADAVMQDYIKSEFTPKLAALQNQLRANPTASLYNQLGNLYLRSGQLSDAKAAYERAAGMGSIGAMTNRANMALNENDNAGAERWFRQALSREPENKAALRGLETIEARR